MLWCTSWWVQCWSSRIWRKPNKLWTRDWDTSPKKCKRLDCAYFATPTDHTHLSIRERYETKIKELEKQQDTLAEKLAKLQQEYQQQVGKVAALR